MAAPEPINWEDPPARLRHRGAPRLWEGRVAALREHPGRWANFGEYGVNTATQLRTGRMAGVNAGDLEVRTVRLRLNYRRCLIFARYIGDVDR